MQSTQSWCRSKIQWLVLDEADRLLDLGFEETLTEILQVVRSDAGNHRVQSALVSATLTPQLSDLSKLALVDALLIGFDGTVDDAMMEHTDGDGRASVPEKITHEFIEVPSSYRLVALGALLRLYVQQSDKCKMIVFVSTCAEVDFLHRVFSMAYWPMIVDSQGVKDKKSSEDDALPLLNCPLFRLHGNLEQRERTQTFWRFCTAESGIMFCTNVAARGLDLPKLNYVIQYDPPEDKDEYVHRVGRAGRMGQVGGSVLMLLPTEKKYLELLSNAGIHATSQRELTALLDSLNDRAFVEKQRHSVSSKRQRHSNNSNIVAGGVALGIQFGRLTEHNRELSELAANAFTAYVRSYATYPRALKHIFHPRQLHLGHVAKSFGLKEQPKTLGKKRSEVEHGKQVKRKKRKMEKMVNAESKRRVQEADFALD